MSYKTTDSLSEINTANRNQTRPFSAVLPTVMGIFRGLSGFFTLTEEERLAAGINFGSQHDMLDRVEEDPE